MPKVHIVHSSYEYEEMFLNRGWEVVTLDAHPDLVQFTGGADVYPPLYGEKNVSSYYSKPRDMQEMAIFHHCIEKELPMAGICRGGQFLNVMNGGRMHQHVEKHAVHGGHKSFAMGKPLIWGEYGFFEGEIQYNEVEEVLVTSTHHQMFIPHPDALLLMLATLRANPAGHVDVESVWYERTKCLCFQPHPEFAEKECQDLYFDFISRYIKL